LRLVSALRWIDRWVCMAGANCCVSRSVKAAQDAITYNNADVNLVR
jgi:hypothetical protein